MLSESTSVLIATARNVRSTDDHVSAAAQAFFGDLAGASRSDLDAAIKSISRHFELPNPSRSAFLALVCGVVVERGGDPMVIAEPLIAGLKPLLVSAGELVDACVERMESLKPGATQAPDSAGEFEKALEALRHRMPSQVAAWQALDQMWNPGVAVFSISTMARQLGRSIRPLTAKIAPYHEAGHWLTLILTVLDREPILVIEPATSRGVVGRFSGVVDNFQLNTLLMASFPEGATSGSQAESPRRVAQKAVDVARGSGPQEQDEAVTSVWNLYTWQAVQSDLRLPDPSQEDSTDFWVWNEGVPADIPVFEGYRVVLLGPQSYPRSWPSQRTFARLSASVDIDKELGADEVQSWLQRIANAPRSA